MTDDRIRSSRVLRRIAEALGADVATFSNQPENADAIQEALELLTAFERIVDRDDRRACLDFVRSVAARQHTS